MPVRATLLAALLALFIVSNVGFPWRMAATGALFALCLGGLAASEARLVTLSRWAVIRLRWSPRIAGSGGVVGRTGTAKGKGQDSKKGDSPHRRDPQSRWIRSQKACHRFGEEEEGLMITER